MTTYTRRGPGQSYLKVVLQEKINSLIEFKDGNLEINPLKVYTSMIAHIEEDAGPVPEHLPKAVTAEQAAEEDQYAGRTSSQCDSSWNHDPVLKHFSLRINAEPIITEARVLNPPTLQFKGSTTAPQSGIVDKVNPLVQPPQSDPAKCAELLFYAVGNKYSARPQLLIFKNTSVSRRTAGVRQSSRHFPKVVFSM
ncbi:MAG: hypothetical protein Q9168_004919 [Polycauliona sp. 1 TL-2023]